MARRGSYAKGVAKREEILERALEVIAREGYRGASVKELAEAVGLSQAGLLHYFDSKEELFTEIVRKRDEVDMAHYGPIRRPMRQPRHCARGYARRHPPQQRRAGPRAALLADVRRRGRPAASGPPVLHRAGRESARVFAGGARRRARPRARSPTASTPRRSSRIFQAVADGLQLQWMLEPDVDMAGIVAQLFDVLTQPDHRQEPR